MGWLDWLFGRRGQAVQPASREPRPGHDEWHFEEITVEEAERRHPGLANDGRAEEAPYIVKPFGFQNPDWEALKAEMQPGDVLEAYVSPPDSWAHLAGRAGVHLKRNGVVIADITTMMN